MLKSLASHAEQNKPHNLGSPLLDALPDRAERMAKAGWPRPLDRVYASRLPDWLKDGLANTVVKEMAEDGTFSMSVQVLVRRGFYVRGQQWKHLTYRVIQYQLMTLVGLGFLELLSGGRGRGKVATYRVNLDALNTLPQDASAWRYANRNPLIPRGVPSQKNTQRQVRVKHATGKHATARLVKNRSVKEQKYRNLPIPKTKPKPLLEVLWEELPHWKDGIRSWQAGQYRKHFRVKADDGKQITLTAPELWLGWCRRLGDDLRIAAGLARLRRGCTVLFVEGADDHAEIFVACGAS